MTEQEVMARLVEMGYEDTIVFKNYGYESALIGVSEDGRAIYDYDKMVNYLVEEEGMTDMDAIEWIDYNTIRALGYMGPDAPIIMHSLEWGN